MFRSAVLVLAALSSVSAQLVVPKTTGLVGGHDTAVENVGWTASVTLKNEVYCAGAIVDNRTIVTAAHCLDGFKVEDLVLRLGSTYRDKEGGRYGVKEFLIHPQYDSTTLENDVAIIRTGGYIDIGLDIKSVSLPQPNQRLPYRRTATISGFGESDDKTKDSAVLKVGVLPIMQPGLCTAIYTFDLVDTMFCAGTFDATGSVCQEDSGSPLVLDNVLIGIASLGGMCADPYQPGVYTNIASVADWIRDAVAHSQDY